MNNSLSTHINKKAHKNKPTTIGTATKKQIEIENKMVDTAADIDVEKMNDINNNGNGEGEGEGAKSKCCNLYNGNVDAIGLSWLGK